MTHQHYAVALFSTLRDASDSVGTIEYAYHHLKVIEHFGSFPHRNSILARVSISKELDLLQQPGASFRL